MPIYYHIDVSRKIYNEKFIENKPLFFSKKNSFWYNLKKEIASKKKGYCEYKIYLPKHIFTTSFNPIKKNVIVKINKKNIKIYKSLIKKYEGRTKFINEMNKRNIIGIDNTSFSSLDFHKNDKHKKYNASLEGFIWKDIKITHL